MITQMKSAISNLLVCYWNQNSYSNYWVVDLTFLNLKVFFSKNIFLFCTVHVHVVMICSVCSIILLMSFLKLKI